MGQTFSKRLLDQACTKTKVNRILNSFQTIRGINQMKNQSLSIALNKVNCIPNKMILQMK